MICESSVLCECSQSSHSPRFVVLTGGPGAGKTAVLELARKSFCEHIAVLPEAASIVFGGGFWRKENLAAKRAAQRAIFHVQSELEQMVKEERRSAIVLCDRGTLDGLAYWPSSEDAFWKELGTRREQELSRYHAVIHLRTPGLSHGYNRSNPVRIESAPEAAEIDARIVHAWEGHPRRFFVESSEDFLKKVEHAIELIRGELPECCRSHPVEGLSRDV